MKGSIKDGLIYALVFWFIVLIFGAIALDKLIMPYLAGHFKSNHTVPNVTGKSVQEAKQVMRAQDLNVTIAPEKRNSGLPEGMVVQQIPAAGKEVRAGRVIQLVLSAGAKELIMQNLRGTTLASASQQLNQMGLKYSIQYISDASVSPGSVVRTQPEANSIVPVETNVLLVVAEGTPLPNFVGKNIAEVKQSLDSLDLNLSIIKAEPGQAESGRVLKQNPKAGSALRKRQTISLTVSP